MTGTDLIVKDQAGSKYSVQSFVIFFWKVFGFAVKYMRSYVARSQ